MSEHVPNRVLTAPLVAFLVVVAGIVGTALWTRHPSPDLEGSIEILADGDLDLRERQRMLLRVIDLAGQADSLRARWAGALAAVSLQDREGFAGFESKLGDGAARVLPEAERRWLSLGDVVLANVHLAMDAEASADKELAVKKWGQVAAQGRITANRFASELAAAALERLE